MVASAVVSDGGWAPVRVVVDLADELWVMPGTQKTNETTVLVVSCMFCQRSLFGGHF